MSHFRFHGDPFAHFGFGSSFGSGFFGRQGFGSGFGHREFGRQHGFPGVGQQYRYSGRPQRRARRQGPAEVVDLGGKILGEVVDEEDGRAAEQARAGNGAAGPGTARNQHGQRYPRPPQQEYRAHQDSRSQFQDARRAPEDARRFAQGRAKTQTSGAYPRGGYPQTSSTGNGHNSSTKTGGPSTAEPCEHSHWPQFTPRQQYPTAPETPRQASSVYTTPPTCETPRPRTTTQRPSPKSTEGQQHYRTSYYPTGRTMPSPRNQRPCTTPSDHTPTPAAPPRKRKRSEPEEVIVISDDDGSGGAREPKKKRRETFAGGEGLRGELRDPTLRRHRGDCEDTAQFSIPSFFENGPGQAHTGQ